MKTTSVLLSSHYYVVRITLGACYVHVTVLRAGQPRYTTVYVIIMHTTIKVYFPAGRKFQMDAVTASTAYVCTSQLHCATPRHPQCVENDKGTTTTMTVITPSATYKCTLQMNVIWRQPTPHKPQENTVCDLVTQTAYKPQQDNYCLKSSNIQFCSEQHLPSTVTMATLTATYICTPQLRAISRQANDDLEGETDCGGMMWPEPEMEQGPSSPDKLVV